MESGEYSNLISAVVAAVVSKLAKATQYGHGNLGKMSNPRPHEMLKFLGFLTTLFPSIVSALE
jgi:hypothetical protein